MKKLWVLSFFIRSFYKLKRPLFFQELHRTLCLDPFYIKTKDGKILNFLTKTMDYPHRKSANLGFFNPGFYGLKRLIFFVQLYQTLFLDPFCIKTKDKKIWIFWQTPVEKCKFWAFLKSMFFYSQIRLLFLLELYQTLFTDQKVEKV